MMNNIYKRFSTKEEIADTLAYDISNILEKSIEKNGIAKLLLSGGNTPKLFLNKLSTSNLNWKKVIVGLVDERWLESSHKDSNEKMIQKELFINNAKEAKFIGMYQNQNIEISENICSDLYQKYFQHTDVLILGMGIDGHTASLFPYNQKLGLAYDTSNPNFCISITPSDAPHKRMSLTLNSILNSNNIFLHIEGKDKCEVYNKVIKSENSRKYPIIKVLNNTKEIKVYKYE